ncbi:MAG: Type secretion protein family [Pedosphaera sp.]|nr:Type secretion protein family [Pedosphaera sp.]
MSAQIHWQEGLFLQPHHLQRMQKAFRDQIHDERRLGWAYPYGVVEARLSRDELENMRIRFERLRVVMPSGLEVNFPENCDLPSLDIKQAFSKGSGSFTVLLGVPLWQNSRANAMNPSQQSDSRVKLLYRVGETECTDENTGENPKPIQVRRINSRLMFELEDASDMEVVPLMRIVRAVGDDVGLPKEDPEYVPACMVLSGSPVLREMVRDLVSQVEASRKELVVQLSRGGFSLENMRGLQFEQLMRLRTLSRYSAQLPQLVQSNGLDPFTIYLELRGLLAELAALHPDRDEFESSPYSHENPYFCFRELSTKIRAHLRGAVAPSFIKVPFSDMNGLLTATFTDDHFTQPNAYFLAIKTRLDGTALARYVQDGDKFKLMPQSLATRAIRGIELKEERHPPLELPAASDLFYFRMEKAASARMWQQIQSEKLAAVRWTGNELDWSDASFMIYMTVPNSPLKP